MRKSSKLSKLRQRGATAIEFAFVFPLLFAVTYAGIVYGYIYYLQQSLNFVAEEATRYALAAVTPGIDKDYCASLRTQAQISFTNYITNLNAGGTGSNPLSSAVLTPSCPVVDGVSTFKVQLQLATATLTAPGGAFAQVTLPFIGVFPPVPAFLGGNAVIAIN